MTRCPQNHEPRIDFGASAGHWGYGHGWATEQPATNSSKLRKNGRSENLTETAPFSLIPPPDRIRQIRRWRPQEACRNDRTVLCSCASEVFEIVLTGVGGHVIRPRFSDRDFPEFSGAYFFEGCTDFPRAMLHSGPGGG